MFENVDGRQTDDGVIGILIAHLGAFGPGELKSQLIAFTLYRIFGHGPSSRYSKQLFQLSSIHDDHMANVDCLLSVVTSHHFLSSCTQVCVA